MNPLIPLQSHLYLCLCCLKGLMMFLFYNEARRNACKLKKTVTESATWPEKSKQMSVCKSPGENMFRVTLFVKQRQRHHPEKAECSSSVSKMFSSGTLQHNHKMCSKHKVCFKYKWSAICHWKIETCCANMKSEITFNLKHNLPFFVVVVVFHWKGVRVKAHHAENETTTCHPQFPLVHWFIFNESLKEVHSKGHFPEKWSCTVTAQIGCFHLYFYFEGNIL